MTNKTIRKANKKEGEELQEYLKTMKRHGVVPVKKGKGSKYNRAKEKRTLMAQEVEENEKNQCDLYGDNHQAP